MDTPVRAFTFCSSVGYRRRREHRSASAYQCRSSNSCLIFVDRPQAVFAHTQCSTFSAYRRSVCRRFRSAPQHCRCALELQRESADTRYPLSASSCSNNVRSLGSFTLSCLFNSEPLSVCTRFTLYGKAFRNRLIKSFALQVLISSHIYLYAKRLHPSTAANT